MSLSRRDYESYKASVDKLVYRYLSHSRTAAAHILTSAADSGYDKRKVAEKLLDVADKALANKLADKANTLLEDLGVNTKSSRKRSLKENVEEPKAENGKRESKRPKLDFVEPVQTTGQPTPPPMTPGAIHAEQIKEIMAKAQADVEKRKAAMLQNPQIQTAVPIVPVAAAASQASRLSELQARIANKMGALKAVVPGIPAVPPTAVVVPGVPGLVVPGVPGVIVPGVPGAIIPGFPAAPPKAERPPPLILDKEGRTLDKEGKEVTLKTHAPTLKANIRAKRREEFKQHLSTDVKPPTEEAPEYTYFDSRIAVRGAARPAKLSFAFNEPGKYVKQAKVERAKSRLVKLETEILTAARRTGISSAAALAAVSGGPGAGEVPAVEWWDAVLLRAHRYPAQGEEIEARSEYIGNLVEHPLEVKPAGEEEATDLKVFLTAKERKKLRRMNRREAWKEKQDKIRLGLEPAPEAKVRMANLMRVLGTEAVLDPTKMEKHVRDQMAKRLREHEERNLERKLTPQQRKEKRVNKLKEDTSAGVRVTVFRVTDLSNGSHKFKVETNAKQLFMTGVVVLCGDCNVVVVEGGPKQSHKYKHLMLNRIKWKEEARNAECEPKCSLVWEGHALERSFGEMQFKACPSEAFAREHFRSHGVEHYWALAYGSGLAEAAEP